MRKISVPAEKGKTMNWYDAMEEAYNKGYKKGMEDACKWISVTERLPEQFVSVLGYMPASAPFPPVRECYMVGNVFYFPALQDTQMVTHWMPIPEAPGEVE